MVPYENVADHECSSLSYDVDVGDIFGSNTTNNVSFLTHRSAACTDIGIINNNNNKYHRIFYPLGYHIAPNIAARKTDDVFTFVAHAVAHADEHASVDAYAPE